MTAPLEGLDGPVVFEPAVFRDERGSFYEAWNSRAFAEATGVSDEFVQDNHSVSALGVIRGLHYQLPPKPQGKLVRSVVGAVFDVVVDIRRSSPSFGRWAGIELTAKNRRQVWVPGGFAHGFLALSDGAELAYKTTEYYEPSLDRSIRWDDPEIGIEWPLGVEPILSDKDRTAPFLAEAEVYP